MLLYSNLQGRATHTLQLCLRTWNINQALRWGRRFIGGGCQANIWKVVKNLKTFCFGFCYLVIWYYREAENQSWAAQTNRRALASTLQFSVPTFGTLAASQCKVTANQARGDGNLLQQEQEPFHVTHTEMLWNRSKHTRPLSHKSISSTEAGDQQRLAQRLLCGLMFQLELSWQAQTHKNI